MAKRLSDKEKKEIIELFKHGNTIENLSKKYDFTKLTISRNLKKYFGEEKYKELNQINKSSNFLDVNNKKNHLNSSNSLDLENYEPINPKNLNLEEESNFIAPFVEIIPLNTEIENETQKDLSSIPLSEINLPKIAYMIVDKKVELQTKYLKDYPEWQFLSQEELNRKTIEIHVDLKIAKRSCRKEEKVIKVPNTDVFKIVAPILLNKGISRIVSAGKLIAL